MKFLIALSLILLCSCGHTQHTELSLSYLYYLSGSNVVSVTASSGDCSPDVRLSWFSKAGLQRDTVIAISMGSTAVIHLPGKYTPGSEIKAKSDAPCSSTGWVTALTPGVLAINFVSFHGVRRRMVAIIEYELYFSEPTDYAVLQRSDDGRTFTSIHLITTATERTYQDLTATGHYYRLMAPSTTGNADYSRIVYVPPADEYAAAQMALYDYNGNYAGTFNPGQRLPVGNWIAKTAFETRQIRVVP